MKDKTTSILVLTFVLAIGLALVAQYGIQSHLVLAKSSKGSKSSKSSSSTGSSSSSSKSSSAKLKSLVSCVTSSSKTASGELSQSDVMNCYSQAYANHRDIQFYKSNCNRNIAIETCIRGQKTDIATMTFLLKIKEQACRP